MAIAMEEKQHSLMFPMIVQCRNRVAMTVPRNIASPESCMAACRSDCECFVVLYPAVGQVSTSEIQLSLQTLLEQFPRVLKLYLNEDDPMSDSFEESKLLPTEFV